MSDSPAIPLIANLRFHRAWLAICENYLGSQPKADVAEFLQKMFEVERQALELLALALRQHDIPPTDLGAQDELVADAMMRRGTRVRVEFLQIGLTRSIEWYRARLQDATDPNHALWQELHDLHTVLAEELQPLVLMVERSSLKK